MQESIIYQLFFFAESILFGVFVFLIYDVIRSFRRVVPHGIVLISLEDMLFWIFTGMISFRFLYWYNWGQLRSYFFLGLGIGVCIYYMIISRWAIKLFCFLFSGAALIGKQLVRQIRRPCHQIRSNLKWQLKKEQKNVKMIIKKEQKKR